MAIVENFWLKGQTKKLGGSVIYQAMGQTRQRALASSVSNPRTQAQMTQRVKWANLVNLYRANSDWMKYAFETKKASQSDYNKFMSLNVTNSNIFLPKNVAAAGGAVVQSYLITQGSLPSIETTYVPNSSWWATNIYLGNSYIFSTPTVAAFTRVLLDNNPAMREGDQLSFIRMTQMTNAGNGAPYVIVRKYEMILSLTNSASVWDYLPSDYIDSSEAATNSQLVVKDSGNAGGFVLILSRTIAGKTYVSSQRIVVANNLDIITAYSSTTALQNAINSYGNSQDAFLTSTTANQADNVYVPNSIVGISVQGNTIAPGSFWNIKKSDATKGVDIFLAANASGESVSVRIDYASGGRAQSITLSNPVLDGDTITASMPAAADLPNDGAAMSLLVIIDDNPPIETGFTVPNEYTIVGLE
jgi:hypothetical protein